MPRIPMLLAALLLASACGSDASSSDAGEPPRTLPLIQSSEPSQAVDDESGCTTLRDALVGATSIFATAGDEEVDVGRLGEALGDVDPAAGAAWLQLMEPADGVEPDLELLVVSLDSIDELTSDACGVPAATAFDLLSAVPTIAGFCNTGESLGESLEEPFDSETCEQREPVLPAELPCFVANGDGWSSKALTSGHAPIDCASGERITWDAYGGEWIPVDAE